MIQATPLTNAIDAIITERKKKAAYFDSKRESYQKLSDTVDQIVQSINEINSINARNSEVQRLLGPRFLDAIKRIDSEDISAFKSKYRELDTIIGDVSSRYNKDEINISVVGLARQGKSTLLQSISNLDNKIIPAFDLDDCTGAVSILRNVPNSGVSAKVYFYTKAQMIEIINNYISALSGGKVGLISSFDQIKLNDDDIATIKVLGADESKKLKKFLTYVENFDDWAPLVEQYDGTDNYMSITDENEIIKYVSQYNGLEGDDAQSFYYCFAVRKVEISCPFKYGDAGKIVLRDSIGLGDDGMIGLKEAVIDAITDKCDAAVIVQNPIAYQSLRSEDMNLYRSLRQSCVARGLDMNKWFFYFVNHTKGEEGKKNRYNEFDNIRNCESLEKDIRNNTANAGVFIADASNQDEVTKNLLVPMLTLLKDNLPQLDASLENQIDQKVQEIKEVFKRILNACTDAQKELNVDYNSKIFAAFNGTNIYIDLTQKLDKLVDEYRKKTGENCTQFETVTKYLVPGGPDSRSIVPTVKEVQAALNVGGYEGRPERVCVKLMSKVKNDFTKKFVEMDEFLFELVVELQSKVYEIFNTTMKFNKLLGDDALGRIEERLANEYLSLQQSRGNTRITKEQALEVVNNKVFGAWFAEARNLLEFRGNFKGQLYEEIYTALDFMATLNLSARSFLLPRIRDCINILDPFAPGFHLPYLDDATAIRFYIESQFKTAQREAARKIYDLLGEPHLFLLSAVTEFRDRILYSCIINENDADGTVSLMAVDDAWKEKIYGEKGQEIFNKDALEARTKAEELEKKFKEISLLFAEINNN